MLGKISTCQTYLENLKFSSEWSKRAEVIRSCSAVTRDFWIAESSLVGIAIGKRKQVTVVA